MRRGRARSLRRGLAVAGGAVFTCLVAACGGSSDPSETAPNTNSLISDICRKTREAPCGSAAAEQECQERLGRDRDDAANEGCDAELSAYLNCANASRVGCSAIEGEPLRPEIGSSCGEKRGILSECITGVGPDCGIGYGPRPDSVSCGVNCPEFSSMCTGPSQFGPLECTCATGPHAGVAFQATDCSRGIIMATGHTCR